MKKSILSVLSLALAVLILVSCTQGVTVTTAGDTGTDPVTTTSAPVTNAPVTTEEKYEIQSADLGGAEISVVIGRDGGSGLNYKSVFARDNWEEERNDLIDQVVYERNQLVMEKLNCKIRLYEEYDDTLSVSEKYADQLLAGDPEIDIIAGSAMYDLSLAREGYLADLSDYSDYIHTDRVYWSDDAIDALNIGEGDEIYWLTGLMNLGYVGGIQTVLVNETLYNSFAKGTYGDLYELVNEGEWTMDTMFAMSRLVPQYHEWTHGTVLYPSEANQAFIISSGIPFSAFTDEASLQRERERLTLFADKFYALVNNSSTQVLSGEMEALNYFASDSAMIVFTTNGYQGVALRDMESSYVMLPYPKLDGSQEDYYCAVTRDFGVYGINRNSEEVLSAVKVLEALAVQSYNWVYPEYRTKIASYFVCKCHLWKVEKQFEDFVLSKAVFDPVYIWGDYITDNGNEGMREFFDGMLFLDKNTFLEGVFKKSPEWQSSADKLYDEFVFQK